ncbi:MAG: hypothetical protein ACRD0Y_06650 [Terriglobales bacterium]
MSELELKRMKDRMLEFRKTHTTRESCLQSLQEAGIVNAQGKLAAPYRPPARRNKSK